MPQDTGDPGTTDRHEIRLPVLQNRDARWDTPGVFIFRRSRAADDLVALPAVDPRQALGHDAGGSAMMMTNSAMYQFIVRFLCPLMLYFFSTIEASAPDAWEEDFRRCRVLKQFPQGTVIIVAGEQIELEIHWSDRVDLNEVAAADISVQIDNTPLLRPKPLKNEITGMVYGFELGSFNAILPALSRGKRLQISFLGKPERSLDLNIGAGRKAVAFLKKCDKFWSCVNERDLMGKKKHCFLPRDLR